MSVVAGTPRRRRDELGAVTVMVAVSMVAVLVAAHDPGLIAAAGSVTRLD